MSEVPLYPCRFYHPRGTPGTAPTTIARGKRFHTQTMRGVGSCNQQALVVRSIKSLINKLFEHAGLGITKLSERRVDGTPVFI